MGMSSKLPNMEQLFFQIEAFVFLGRPNFRGNFFSPGPLPSNAGSRVALAQTRFLKR